MSFELNLASLPNHILYLEGVQLSYIKVFVHIFNLWQSDKPCYIKNAEFAARTGLNKETVSNAITFFEKHKILKRVQKGIKRYLVQPAKGIETEFEAVDNSSKNSIDVDHPPELAHQPAGVSPSNPPELAHTYNNKYNNKTNKSSCSSNDKKLDNAKKHEWTEQKKSPLASVENQSTSFKKEGNPTAQRASSLLENFLNKENNEQHKRKLSSINGSDGFAISSEFTK